MRWIASILIAVAVAAFLLARGRGDVSAFVGRYVRVERASDDRPGRRLALERDAFLWTAVGAFVGILLAQGDLFIAGPARPIPILGVLGAGAGWLTWSARRSTRRERQARALRYELPVICDALALQIVSGESVASAVANITEATTGVASHELREALDAADVDGMQDALADACRSTAHPDARRLYRLLAHAHASGGRLADALVDLASDYRGGLERDLATESGRRMVTTYGPVLALMVPTALLFLLYPTLLGLRTLSGTP